MSSLLLAFIASMVFLLRSLLEIRTLHRYLDNANSARTRMVFLMDELVNELPQEKKNELVEKGIIILETYSAKLKELKSN